MPSTTRTLLLSLPLFVAAAASAQEAPKVLADCANIGDKVQRLACFDQLAATPAPRTEPAVVVNQVEGAPTATAVVAVATA